jgi:predicted metal-dependent phosphoesterase TrpH
MSAPVDLHIHSNRSSDGTLPPSQIIKLAYEKKMKAISIADHDTVAAYPEALLCEHADDVEVIPSVELTTRLEEREFHILFPFIEWKNDGVTELVGQVAERRIQEAQERVEKLQSLGMDIDWDDVLHESGPFPPLGVTIALAFLKKAKNNADPAHKKYFNSTKSSFNPYAFYKDYFADGKPASVPRRNLNAIHVIKLAKRVGGVPVLAHPGATFMNVSREDVDLLKEAGLEGLEVFTSYHDKTQTEVYKNMATEFDLVMTAGSDYHGSIKPHIPFGFLEEGDYAMVEELKKRRP